MSLFTPSLWPGAERVPLRRVLLSVQLAPLLIAILLSGIAFGIVGMTETRREDVLTVTVQSALALSALVYVFTLTFGLAGFAILWKYSLRGVLIWAATGAVMGALAGLLGSLLVDSFPMGIVVPAFSVLGWAVFMLIRWFAGVRSA